MNEKQQYIYYGIITLRAKKNKKGKSAPKRIGVKEVVDVKASSPPSIGGSPKCSWVKAKPQASLCVENSVRRELQTPSPQTLILAQMDHISQRLVLQPIPFLRVKLLAKHNLILCFSELVDLLTEVRIYKYMFRLNFLHIVLRKLYWLGNLGGLPPNLFVGPHAF